MSNIAAIDLGSNAARITIASLDDHQHLRFVDAGREPVRLGQDVFSTGRISPETLKKLIISFARFRSLLDKHQVQRIRACGTSALREAENRTEIVSTLDELTGIELVLIDGQEEIRLVSCAVCSKLELDQKRAILIDIGGGSVEVAFLHNGQISLSRSFQMGAVRLLHLFGPQIGEHERSIELVRDYLAPLKSYIRQHRGQTKEDLFIGVGGNIEALTYLRKQTLDPNSLDLLYLNELKQLIARLQALTVEQRMVTLDLPSDRADVIFPAALVLEYLLIHSGFSTITVPHVSIREGMLIELARDISGKNCRFVL
ncbi:hypothetical protein JXQ70_12150 [bacterium]|nr:hypothetical protein [bacterium]